MQGDNLIVKVNAAINQKDDSIYQEEIALLEGAECRGGYCQ